MTKPQLLLKALLLGCVVIAARAGAGQEIPALSLNEPLPPAQDCGEWKDAFGDDESAPEAPAILVHVREDEIEIRSPHRLLDQVTELVFANAEGTFEASWCSGRLAFASLVLPQLDESDVQKEWRTIPMLDLAGKSLDLSELGSVTRSLAGTPFLPHGQDEPVIDVDLARFPATTVAALLLVEQAERDWSSGAFRCFDAGNRFVSHSSHACPCQGGVLGEAEMFTWHQAAMRLAWDLHAEGDWESDPIPLEAGAAFRRGGTRIELVGFEDGEYRRINGGRRIPPGDPARYRRVEGGEVPRTAFLAGSLPIQSLRRIEGSLDGGPWQELPFTPEEDGIIAIDLPEVGALSELRAVWAPRRLRVVVDVPAIGGGLPENEDISTYNEVSFRLHQREVDNDGLFWRIWQLTGRFPRIEGESYRQQPVRKASVDPERLYRLEDLLAIWRELNPEFSIAWDGQIGSLVVRER